MGDDGGETKIWVAVRADLMEAMGLGKAVVQAGHAFGNGMVAALASHPEAMAEYLAGATPKISVVVKDEAALLRVRDEARDAGIAHFLVLDAGRTVFPEPTHTMCSFGPCRRDALPPFLGRLRMAPSGNTAGRAAGTSPKERPASTLRDFLKAHGATLWTGGREGREAIEPEAAMLAASLAEAGCPTVRPMGLGVHAAGEWLAPIDADDLAGRHVADGTTANVPLADAVLVVKPTRAWGKARGETGIRSHDPERPLCEVEVRMAPSPRRTPLPVPKASRRELFEGMDPDSIHRTLAMGEGDLHCVGGPAGWVAMRAMLALVARAAADDGVPATTANFLQASPDTPLGAWLSGMGLGTERIEGARSHWTTRALQHVVAWYAPCRTGGTRGRYFPVEATPVPSSATLRAAEGPARRRVAAFLHRTGASASLVAEAEGRKG